MKRTVIFGLVGGLVIALLTGLVSNQTLLGGEWYGYPFAWLIRRVLAPEYFPWHVDLFGLAADVLAWALVSSILLGVSLRIRRK